MTQNVNDGSKSSWIPGFVRNDFLRKAIALFFAVLFYFIVTSRLGIEEQINNIPVDIDLPTTLVNLGALAPRVSLVVKGSKGILKQSNRTSFKIQAQVKLSDYIPGEVYNLRLTADNVSAPLGVTVIRIDPRDLALNLDRKVSKKVKIEPTFTNKDTLPQGYAVDKVVFQPSEVLITGPESILEKIRRVKSAPIPLSSSLTDSFDYKTKILKEPSTSVSPDKVNAQVQIIRQSRTVTIKNIAIQVMESPGKSGKFKVELLSSPHAAVTLTGLKGTIDLLKNESVKPYIDVAALDTEGTFSVNVSCWINSNDRITVKSIYPEKVQVKLTKVK
ncbi:MAG: CdaR family protein [Victivallaceae bacterium]|nr:CdaR family protein [Victivallaceae bacterium]